MKPNATRHLMRLCAESVSQFKLVITIITGVLILTMNAGAQLIPFFNFGGGANTSSIVFMVDPNDINAYSITFDPIGFVFNGASTYDGAAVVAPGVIAGASDNVGYYRPGNTWPGPYPISDVINNGGLLECGKYWITITQTNTGWPQPSMSFYLDLIDHKWLIDNPDTSCHSILFQISSNNVDLTVLAGVAEKMFPTQTLDLYRPIVDNDNLHYWEMARCAVDANYQRDRDGFILPLGSYPGYRAVAWMDFNPIVTGNMTIPLGKTLYVTNDKDTINWGDVTYLHFNPGISCFVQGTLIADPTITGWTVWTANPLAPWNGIKATKALPASDPEVDLTNTTIENATNNGLDVSNCNNAPPSINLVWCGLEHCGASGAFIAASNTNMQWSDFEYNGSHGVQVQGVAGSTPGAYVSKFYRCLHAWNTLNGLFAEKSADIYHQRGTIYYNATNGAYFKNGSRGKFDSCQINNNTQAGISLAGINMSSVWTTVQNSRIFGNPIGLLVNGSSKLRGWYANPEPAVGDEWMADDSIGHNCITENNTNIEGTGTCMIDLGRTYYEISGVDTIPHYQGWYNDITDPVNFQTALNTGADASLVLDYWSPAPLGPRVFNVLPFTFNYLPQSAYSNGMCTGDSRLAPREQIPDELAKRLAALNIEYNPNVSPVRQIRDAIFARQKQHDQNMLHADESGTASGYFLSSAYPNPFNPSTRILFTLPKREHATLNVYDAYGRIVLTPADGIFEAGSHDVMLDGSRLNSGMYIYMLRTNDRVLVNKAVLIK